MKDVIRITPEQIQRLARGETVEIAPARVGYQIVLDIDGYELLTAEYVETSGNLET